MVDDWFRLVVEQCQCEKADGCGREACGDHAQCVGARDERRGEDDRDQHEAADPRVVAIRERDLERI